MDTKTTLFTIPAEADDEAIASNAPARPNFIASP